MAEQNKDASGDTMWLLFSLVACMIAIGYFFGTPIKQFYLTLKLWELKLITLVYPSETMLAYIQAIETKTIKEWSYQEMKSVGNFVGYFVNIPLAGLIGYFSYKVWDKNPSQKFKRILNMQTLKESEQRIWPYIAPVVNVELIKEDFEKGPYAMALKPYDFAIKYKLLEDEKNVNSMNRSKAQKLMISQLGKLYEGPARLKKHEAAFLAIFAAHGCGDKVGAMNAINKMALSAAKTSLKKMPDLSATEPLMKYLDNPQVKEIINKHAYIYTILAQMLEFARTTGVFPDSYWKWLKPRDRVMYFTLNCVGRQVCFSEVSGIFGHWRAEQTAKHKLERPFVDKAVDGLERALAEVKLV